MATAGREAAGGADAVRLPAAAKNVTAGVQRTRTAGCMQTPVGRWESCITVLTQPVKHRSCHHLKSKSYIDLAPYCIKFCTFIVLYGWAVHAHGAMQNRVPARALAGTIAGTPALPACTAMRTRTGQVVRVRVTRAGSPSAAPQAAVHRRRAADRQPSASRGAARDLIGMIDYVPEPAATPADSSRACPGHDPRMDWRGGSKTGAFRTGSRSGWRRCRR